MQTEKLPLLLHLMQADLYRPLPTTQISMNFVDQGMLKPMIEYVWG